MIASEPRLARRVGAVALVTIALAIVFFVFVFDRIEWGRHVRVRAYFHHTGGLREGAPFVVAGRAIGRVEAIALSPRGAPGPLGGDEGVAVTVAIDASDTGQLARGGDVFVASRGALSEKYLELGAAPEGAPMLREGDQLLGRDPPSLDRVLQRTWDNLNAFRSFLDDIRPEVHALREQLAVLRATIKELAPDVALRDDLDALIAEAERTANAVGGRAGFERIGALVDHARVTLALARVTLDKLGAKAEPLVTSVDALRSRIDRQGADLVAKVELAVDRVRAAIDKVDPLLAQIAAINERIARNEGSLLKLMNDPEFPEDAKELGKILKRQPWKLIDHPHD